MCVYDCMCVCDCMCVDVCCIFIQPYNLYAFYQEYNIFDITIYSQSYIYLPHNTYNIFLANRQVIILCVYQYCSVCLKYYLVIFFTVCKLLYSIYTHRISCGRFKGLRNVSRGWSNLHQLHTRSNGRVIL